MKECSLKIETEALISAAQDQALSNNHHQTQILGINQNSQCRMCKETIETVSHISNMSPKPTTNNYLKTHQCSRNFLLGYMSALIIIIIIMDIFQCYFSREHISLSLKRQCEHRIRKNNRLKAMCMMQNNI